MEDDDFIDTVQELRFEGVLQLAKYLPLHCLVIRLMGFILVFRLFEADRGFLVQQGRADVRGHDHNGIAEVYSATLSVGQLAILQYLEQHVENVRVSLLDFVEQDYTIGLATNSLSELTALFITDISRRSTNQPGSRMALHEFRHVNFDKRFFTTKHEFSKSAS